LPEVFDGGTVMGFVDRMFKWDWFMMRIYCILFLLRQNQELFKGFAGCEFGFLDGIILCRSGKYVLNY
jgi:hypothetical protein